LVWSRVIASSSLGRLGRLREAADIARDGAAASRHEPHHWYHLFMLGEALGQAGQFASARQIAEEEYERAVEERSAEPQAYFAWQLAKTVGERGHVETSIRLGREAVALFRRVERRTTIQDALTHLALAYALGGRDGEAAAVLDEVDASRRPAAFWTAVDLSQTRAWTAVAAGDLPSARRYFAEAAATGEAVGDMVGAVSALHGLARIGRSADVIDRLEELATGVEGELVAARVRHTRALAGRDAAELEASSAVFEAMGAELLAAEAAAHAAAAWRASHATRRTAAAEHRAAFLAARTEGARTPALRAANRAELTPAEYEAALLAAAGRSNREIADELYLSVRTIEGRLQRVYEKLGIAGRAELTAALDGVSKRDTGQRVSGR